MKLIFEGQAIVERAFEGVKFVGRYVECNGREKYVICRVSREALEHLFNLTKPTPEELLAAYKSASADVNRLASAQFAGGIERPLVTAQDLIRDRQNAAAA